MMVMVMIVAVLLVATSPAYALLNAEDFDIDKLTTMTVELISTYINNNVCIERYR
jgi:cytochrome c oxidase assembly factor CtaG